MAKPLRSDDPNPKDVSFSHFGVLDDGKRSRGAAITSISINVAIALIVIILGYVAKNNPIVAKQLAAVYLPPKPPEVKPAPKPPPPPPPKPLPQPPKMVMQPPRVKLPEVVKVPDLKPILVPTPRPVVLAPPAPRAVKPPPAPTVVHLGTPKAASIANNDAHPSAVRMGNPEIRALNGPAVATPVNLGGGIRGMSASNTGSGPRATSVNLGSGSPEGSDIHGRGRGAVPIKGLANGVPGGTGKGAYRGPVQVQLQAAETPARATRPPAVVSTAERPSLVVLYKPEPAYTAEARAKHVEGTVTLHIRVLPSGEVEVLNVVHGLDPGLDQSAIQATRATRFKPPVDGAGHPTEVETNVIVRFQLS